MKFAQYILSQNILIDLDNQEESYPDISINSYHDILEYFNIPSPQKILYIIRGIPGSGKTTFAKTISPLVFSADYYFINSTTGVYEFNPKKISNAHFICKQQVEQSMHFGLHSIAVANTFTQLKEFQGYQELAGNYNYKTFVLTIENYHGSSSVHNVPEATINNMKSRFKIQL